MEQGAERPARRMLGEDCGGRKQPDAGIAPVSGCAASSTERRLPWTSEHSGFRSENAAAGLYAQLAAIAGLRGARRFNFNVAGGAADW